MSTPIGIVRMKEVEKTCCMSENTIRRRIKEGLFPSSISLGGRCVGWRIADIETWISNPEAFGARNA